MTELWNGIVRKRKNNKKIIINPVSFRCTRNDPEYHRRLGCLFSPEVSTFVAQLLPKTSKKNKLRWCLSLLTILPVSPVAVVINFPLLVHSFLNLSTPFRISPYLPRLLATSRSIFQASRSNPFQTSLLLLLERNFSSFSLSLKFFSLWRCAIASLTPYTVSLSSFYFFF